MTASTGRRYVRDKVIEREEVTPRGQTETMLPEFHGKQRLIRRSKNNSRGSGVSIKYVDAARLSGCVVRLDL